ncbi:MAG: hypothetical protein V5A27_08440 [Halapricum sp.]
MAAQRHAVARAVRERISELSAGAGTGGSGEDGESADSAQLEELVSDGHNGRAGGQRQDHEETGTDHQQD